jgi:glycosyltransferase involved in cell wall biosynthesis
MPSERRIRVLVATGLYPPETGGPATYSKLLFDKLPAHGFDVDILPFSSVRDWPLAVRHVIYFLKVLSRGRSADIIYAQDAVSVGFAATFANVFLRKKFVVKIVGDHIWEQGVQRFGLTETLDEYVRLRPRLPLYLRFLRAHQRDVVRRAHLIITPSEYLKRVVSTWGVPDEKITVIYNSFTFSDKTGRREDIRRSLYFDGKVIFSAGRLVPWKGFDVLIELMPEILAKFPDASLLIAGDGPDFARLKQLIADAKLDTRVALIGRLPPEALFPHIKASDVFVLNTAYEGLSHVLLEAMALGVPIVTTAVGGNPELIEHRKEGILVPLGDRAALLDAICRILGNPDAGRSLGAQAETKLKRFNEDAMLRELSQELRSLLS